MGPKEVRRQRRSGTGKTGKAQVGCFVTLRRRRRMGPKEVRRQRRQFVWAPKSRQGALPLARRLAGAVVDMRRLTWDCRLERVLRRVWGGGPMGRQ